MKILFIEPKHYFERLIDVNALEHEFKVTYGIPCFVYSLVSFLKAYDFVITCIEHSTISRNVIEISKGLGIKTALFMDGTYEFTNATKNPYLKKIDFTLLNSRQFSIIFSPDIMMKKYIENLGAKYCFYLPKHAMFKSNKEKKELLSKKVLITTANSAYFNDEEFYGLVELIKTIVETLKEKDVEYEFRIFDEKLISKLNIPDSQNNIKNDISTCISLFTHIITTPSTIAYTSVQAEKPTALLMYRDSPITQPAGWLFFRGLNFENSMKSFLVEYSERIVFQDGFLSDNERLKSTLENLVVSDNPKYAIKRDFINFTLEYQIRDKMQFSLLKNTIRKIKNVIKNR